jgi:carbon-monoxide dehydrogenase medium subunit
MRRFAYARPETLAEALVLLGTHGTDAVVLAGGTDLVVGLRRGKTTPTLVVDLKRVADLSHDIDVSDDRISIGGAVVMADIVDHPVIQHRLPALVEAAATVGSIQIRNRATLAGNICNGSPAADTAPPLLAYQAVVNIAGTNGMSICPIDDFFLGPGRTVLEHGEIVSSIDLPLADEPKGAAFTRLTRRRGVDLATVSVACSVSAGVARFGLGAVGPRPLLVTDRSGVLADRDQSADARESVLSGLLTAATPISDIRAGEDYRRAMLAVLARRALTTALDRLAQE